MDASGLLDDIDKLSRVLDGPDEEEFLVNDDNYSVKSNCRALGDPSGEAPAYAPASPGKQGCGQASQPGMPQDPACDGTAFTEVESAQGTFSLHFSGGESIGEEGCVPEPQILQATHADIVSSAETSHSLPPASFAMTQVKNALVSSSQVRNSETMSSLLLAPHSDDVMQDFEQLQETCCPDFDPPDAVMAEKKCAEAKSAVNNSVESALVWKVHEVSDRNGFEALQSADLCSKSSESSTTARAEFGGVDGDADALTQLRTRSGAGTSAESSALQGDINKLSRVLATPVAPPMPFECVVSQPTESSDPRCAPSTIRSKSSGGPSSIASISGVQVSSVLGDEVLSQDDFLDDTFIGQDIPVNLENCLALNAAYQEVVDENLTDLEHLLRRNRAKQAEITALLNSDQDLRNSSQGPKSRVPKWNWQMFVDHFVDKDGFGPLANADTKTKVAKDEYDDRRWPRPWLQSERESLFEVVLAEASQRYLRAVQHRVRALRELLQQLNGVAESKEVEATLSDIKSKLEEANQQLAEVKEVSVIDILTEMDDEYDWPKIALTAAGGQRTATECRLQWCNFVRPTISHAKWSPEEDKQVLAASSNRQSGNRWLEAANKLGRTAFQVFQRFAAVLSAPKRTFWTKEDSEHLMQVVREVGIGNYINWSEVALRFPDRSSVQCHQRYLNISSEQVRGRFSEEEDIRLIAAVEELGIRDFSRLRKFIPDRSAKQLQNRYMRYLAPNVSRGEWTREEDEKLVRFVCENGPLWSRAAAEIGGGRSGDICRNRFLRIEAAFSGRGGVPATGNLGGSVHKFYSTYYDNLRPQLKSRLEGLMPDGEKDSTEARRQAAMMLLNDNVKPLRRASRCPILKRDQERKKEMKARRKAEKSKWESASEILFSEGGSPYRRAELPAADAEAAATVARVWCLPPPTLNRLETCAESSITDFDARALSQWCDATLPDAPESSLRQTVSDVLQREYNWRRMPLMPASYASCSAFRSLLLQRPRLEEQIARSVKAQDRKGKIAEFNERIGQWARAAVSGTDKGAEEDEAPPLSDHASRHFDQMVRVRITEKSPGGPPRQFYMTVSAAEAKNHKELASLILRQVPNMVKMDICKARPVTGGMQPPLPPGHPPAADAADAWHLLLARFVSMFFWPALLSLQPPPNSAGMDDHLSDLDESDPVNLNHDHLWMLEPETETSKTVWQLRQGMNKRKPGANRSRPKAKRRKQQ
ncbi:uncharacterized protein LOC122377631 [Amphibalanus amphitrite]|uniref:uncharacterized protein LOC122377631 n=1 Tax=Amphibalanus amphitrite TaxID=1232801 RepID=UPI001C919F9E|nr:uncharacterized protein LOC122377631 [Amphibalanus amphitrite]